MRAPSLYKSCLNSRAIKTLSNIYPLIPSSIKRSHNKGLMDLIGYTKNGRFYQEGKEGEWVDVTEKWKGENKEN